MSDLFNLYAMAGSPNGDYLPESPMRWAADEITRLQSEVERLQGRCEEAEATVAAVGDAFGIGSKARTRGCLEANAQNAAKFSRLLHRVEAEFFSVPGEPDEDYPDDEPQPECVLNSWNNTEEQYVRSFGAALLRKQAEAVEAFAEWADPHWPQSQAIMIKDDARSHAFELRQQADEAEKAGGGE